MKIEGASVFVTGGGSSTRTIPGIASQGSNARGFGAIKAGDGDVYIAAGVESMSSVPPARTSNDPVSLTLAARLQVSPAVSAPRVCRPPCSSVSRSIVYSVDAPRRVSDPSV